MANRYFLMSKSDSAEFLHLKRNPINYAARDALCDEWAKRLGVERITNNAVAISENARKPSFATRKLDWREQSTFGMEEFAKSYRINRSHPLLSDFMSKLRAITDQGQSLSEKAREIFGVGEQYNFCHINGVFYYSCGEKNKPIKDSRFVEASADDVIYAMKSNHR